MGKIIIPILEMRKVRNRNQVHQLGNNGTWNGQMGVLQLGEKTQSKQKWEKIKLCLIYDHQKQVYFFLIMKLKILYFYSNNKCIE